MEYWDLYPPPCKSRARRCRFRFLIFRTQSTRFRTHFSCTCHPGTNTRDTYTHFLEDRLKHVAREHTVHTHMCILTCLYTRGRKMIHYYYYYYYCKPQPVFRFIVVTSRKYTRPNHITFLEWILRTKTHTRRQKIK